jgi:hypothetical protein
MDRLLTGVVVWTTAFLALELPAHFVAGWPYPTLSRTIWDGVAWWHPVAYFVAIFGFVLLGHFELQWSVRWLLIVTAALVVAVLIHLWLR